MTAYFLIGGIFFALITLGALIACTDRPDEVGFIDAFFVIVGLVMTIWSAINFSNA